MNTMSKLDHVYETLRQLPPDRQDEIASFLQGLAIELADELANPLSDAEIRAAIEVGEASGEATEFEFDAFIARKLAG
ncbi:MAG: hypothetical protein D6773_10925 [Alphaproteobacteria bacterium]|nr:MAG: hypothetical protein D6773_10925 [Alphaproteobacteria bacterium]